MSVKGPEKKSYHHGSLRSALIDAAIELLAERGTAEFTLRELAKGLGVTHAATYHHFKDKDDLFAAVAEDGYRRLGEAVEAAAQQAPEHPVLKMREMGSAYVRFACENQAHFRVMFGRKFADISRYPSMEDAGQQTKGLMEQMVHSGHQEGLYEPSADVEELIAVSWSTVHGLALLTINGHFDYLKQDQDLDTFVQRITRHLFMGAGSEHARKAMHQVRESDEEAR